MNRIGSLRRALPLILLLGLLGTLTGCPVGVDSSSASAAAPRFELEAVITASGPRMLRFDSLTGDVWLAAIIGPRVWELQGAEASSPPPPGSIPGRFDLRIVRTDTSPLTLVRIDSETGVAWRLAVPGDDQWIVYQDDY